MVGIEGRDNFVVDDAGGEDVEHVKSVEGALYLLVLDCFPLQSFLLVLPQLL